MLDVRNSRKKIFAGYCRLLGVPQSAPDVNCLSCVLQICEGPDQMHDGWNLLATFERQASILMRDNSGSAQDQHIGYGW